MAGQRALRQAALIEGLESRVLFANTLLYFDADGNTTAATGGTGTWDTTSLVWRNGSPTGALQAWANADPSTTTAVFGGTAGTVTVATGTTINVNTIQAWINGYTINRAGTGTLHLSGTTPIVDPGAVTLTVNAVVSGTSSLTKIGSGTLVLGGANTFSGGLVIKNGTVGSPGISTAFGSGAVTLGDTSGSNSATLAVSGNTGGSITFANAIIARAGSTGTLKISNTAVGAQVAQNETFTGNITVNHDLVIDDNRSSRTLTLSGAISGSSKLTVTGAATSSATILTAPLGPSFTGNVAVQSGTLIAKGAVAGTVRVSGTGIIDPGNSAASTAVLSTGSLTLAGTSTFKGQINGSVIGDSFDQVNVTGTVNLGGAILSLSGTRTANEGHQITLVRNDGTDAVTGTFSGLAEGATVAVNGVNYKISYVGGTGNDVVLTDLSTGALVNNSPFGLSTDSTRGKNFASWVPQTSATGSKWIRGLPVGWSVVEATQGTFNFSVPDAQLSVAQANGQYLIGTFVNAPAWTGESGAFPVNHLTEWSNYVTQVVSHYAPLGVKYWEVWNEPPHYATNGTAAQYAQLVSAAYTAAKAADPTAQIGIAGSSVNIEFIKEAINAGAAGKYDYLTLHPYEMLGTLGSNWEVQYMNVVKDVRKMLTEVDPAKVNVPVIFTEEGAVLSANTTQAVQASLLVKSMAMNTAMGVKGTDWFEGRDGDSGQFGLLDANGVQRTAYTALSTMISYLGQYPQYLGWVKLNNNDWGFVFQGKTENVMVTWAPVGTSDTVNLSSSALIVDALTGTSTNATSFTLADTSSLIVGVPSDLLAQAKANKSLPLPWPVDYTGATSVAFTPNAAPVETGLHVLGASSNFVSAYGETVYNAGNASYTGFGVDPNFLSYDHVPITITVVARRKEANASAGFNLKYESSTTQGYKNSSASWWTVPGNTQWYTKVYTISDPEFNGYWGYNFKLDSDSTTNSQYYIKSITVAKSGLGAVGIGSLSDADALKKHRASPFSDASIS